MRKQFQLQMFLHIEYLIEAVTFIPDLPNQMQRSIVEVLDMFM